ncbi:hypothetical protein M427DRAFT_61858 [Gonapodya prolifera JEL478]|uniref:Uncharacterized protein n=1 Tax=Gonapodya prolifera (strain JEL478) TaxID=1344416 RepID=A0A139A1N0_GONPJ|nr:hypothetical protein M427DRAFT_61858 [Gonapodya prolifera JEL478]|eukprot:KXS10651.1 hypothetical protein M427DRAFT_61858 [Gonapodya prolifera JEL478]
MPSGGPTPPHLATITFEAASPPIFHQRHLNPLQSGLQPHTGPTPPTPPLPRRPETIRDGRVHGSKGRERADTGVAMRGFGRYQSGNGRGGLGGVFGTAGEGGAE